MYYHLRHSLETSLEESLEVIGNASAKDVEISRGNIFVPL